MSKRSRGDRLVLPSQPGTTPPGLLARLFMAAVLDHVNGDDGPIHRFGPMKYSIERGELTTCVVRRRVSPIIKPSTVQDDGPEPERYEKVTFKVFFLAEIQRVEPIEKLSAPPPAEPASD